MRVDDPRDRCPHCGAVTWERDLAPGFEYRDGPKEGDATLCAHCGGLSMYCDDMSRRLPTLGEIDELFRDQRAREAAAFVRAIRELRASLS
ncbi:MAG TPA: hypothetical protein VH539_07035 [Gemmatimonadaceae bacterium]|jgi:hypothetical protein